MPRLRTAALSAVVALAILVAGLATRAMIPSPSTGADILLWFSIYMICGLCITLGLVYL